MSGNLKNTNHDGNGRPMEESVETKADTEIILGLERIRKLLEAIGNPQKDAKIVHIAGTNGKGSVGAYLSYILAASGYRVGRYVSPAVFDDGEKIQVLEMIGGGRGEKEVKLTYIKEEEMTDSVTKIRNAAEGRWKPGEKKPSVFEMETAAAFLYLTKRRCDVLVLETGMGGRLDATNIIDTVECSVIVSVSMDHMAFLGNTLKEIAEEKAGIIKEGSFVVSSPQEQAVEKVLKKTAAEKHSALFLVQGKEAEDVVHSLRGIDFLYREENGRKQKLHIPLLGVHQIENVLTALKTARVLKEKRGYSITEETIREGILRTVWHGRFELLRTDPYFVIDGAHNEAAAKKLAESVKVYFINNENFHGKLIFIIGIFKDKEAEKIIAETAGLADYVLTVTPPSNRGLSSDILKRKAEDYFRDTGKRKTVENCGTVESGLKRAFELAKKEDAVIMFGSLSLFKNLYQMKK